MLPNRDLSTNRSRGSSLWCRAPRRTGADHVGQLRLRNFTQWYGYRRFHDMVAGTANFNVITAIATRTGCVAASRTAGFAGLLVRGDRLAPDPAHSGTHRPKLTPARAHNPASLRPYLRPS
jgi:hypothetical protein